MERRRFYSNPQCKKFYILLQIIMFLFMVITLVMINVDVGIAIMAGFYTIFFAVLLVINSKSVYANIITIDEEKVTSRSKHLYWDDIYITMCNVQAARYSNNYYFYFGKYYLNYDEIKNKEIIKLGFYMKVTKENIDFVLKYNKHRIRILEENSYFKSKEVEKVKEYNKKIFKERK